MASSSNTHVTEGNVTYMKTPQTIELDGPALKAKANKNRELMTLFHYGVQRGRNREVTDIEQLRIGIQRRGGESLDPVKWAEAFKILEDMGMGALIIGRRGKNNRFRWNYSLKAIGTAAMNGTRLNANRIVAEERAGRLVNNYNPSKKIGPSLVDIRAAEKPARLPAPPVATSPATTPSDSGGGNMLYVALRPDFIFEADIPNLTEREADVLCAAIRRCVKA
jgi:hypothetical protein